MLKFSLLIPVLFFALSCSSNKDGTKDVCILLYDLKTKNFNVVQGLNTCSERLPAASTFKIPLAVMAFDTKVLKNANSGFKWDGTKHEIEAWNKDQTAETWMRDSVVWFSQKITAQFTPRKFQQYLNNFKYGNADASGGLQRAWLTPATLKISAYEQVTFLEKLWRGELKASKRAQTLTRSIIAQDVSPRGFKLFGKTGSGFFDKDLIRRVGWFVGYFRNNESDFVFVTNFIDKQKQDSHGYAGPEAKEMTIQFLKENHLW